MEIRSYFTGPAYLPWHRMANIDRWEGPLPQTWIDDQLALQQKIVRRETELGMRPVLPAFAGHVPLALKARYPRSKITPLGQWAGFDPAYQSYFLDPFDSLFGVIQKSFLEEQNRLFGTSHLYGADPFNEVKPPSWEPSYLADAARQIYRSMTQTDTAAQWLQMGWIFYHQRKDWTNERIKAFLKAVPQGKMILLDYFCDNTEVWRLTDAFYGQPYIWSYLGNFGGNTFLKGNIADIEGKLNRVFAEGGDNLWGLGGTLEGFDLNPFMYEYVLEKAWSQGPTDIDRWAEALAGRRLGRPDTNAIKAWQLLFRKIYVKGDLEHQASLICASPCLTGHGSWFTDNTIAYENKDLLRIWGLLLKAGAGTKPEDLPAAYQFDVVNIGRQVLGNYFSVVRDSFSSAYYNRDMHGLYTYGAKMREILADVDRLLSTHPDFLLGKWLQDAASFGNSPLEKKYYNRDARRLLTTWGNKANSSLIDYASRDWAGLIKTYYARRWELFIATVIQSVKNHTDLDEKVFDRRIRDFEWSWTLGTKKYNATPTGGCLKLSRELYSKYASRIDPFHRRGMNPEGTSP
jgi:alpha-N-acetylglucosaminidase